MLFCCVFAGIVNADESNKIERLEMPDGKVYEGVTVMEGTPAWLKIMHKGGIAKLMLSECDEKMQTLYDYDAAAAAAFMKVEAVQDKVDAKKDLARRRAQALKLRDKALAKKKLGARDKLIKLQKELVKPMKFHVIQAQKDGAALCKVQVLVELTKTVRVKEALGVKKKRVNYTSWRWLNGKDNWYYVKGVGAVVDKDVVNGFGILTTERFSYSSVGAGGKTVAVIEVRDKDGAKLGE